MGLAGLTAAVRLARAGVGVALYEAAGHAGGRCRSFQDRKLGVEIDNGNHLLLSGNTRALAYLDAIGSREELTVFDEAVFPFVDLSTGERWSIKLSEGRVPWWLFDPARRVPGAGVMAHLSAGRIMLAGPNATVADVVGREGVLYDRFWAPITMAVLNAVPERASAQLLKKTLLETIGKGGAFARPMIATTSLGRAFIDPALRVLNASGAAVSTHTPLRDLDVGEGAVRALLFEGQRVSVSKGDQVILAVPPARLKGLMRTLKVPDDDCAIVNAHFKVPVGEGERAVDFIGLTNAVTHWIFRRPGLISTTISAAHHLGSDRADSDTLLNEIWSEVRRALSLPADMVPEAQRLIRERRATFDQSPDGVKARPGPTTPLANLTLAGDFVDTGLPATIEGAIRSGEQAVAHILARLRVTGHHAALEAA